MSGRSTHRVWFVSIRLTACPSEWNQCVGCSSLKMGGGEGRGGGCKGVESKLLRTHLLVVSWWDHWKLDLFDRGVAAAAVWCEWGGCVCCGPNLHHQLSISPLPPPLICNSFTLLARVVSARDVVPMGSGGCVPLFLPDALGDTFQHLGEFLPSPSELMGILLIDAGLLEWKTGSHNIPIWTTEPCIALCDLFEWMPLVYSRIPTGSRRQYTFQPAVLFKKDMYYDQPDPPCVIECKNSSDGL